MERCQTFHSNIVNVLAEEWVQKEQTFQKEARLSKAPQLPLIDVFMDQ